MQNNEQKKKEKEEEPITIIMNYEQNIQNYICYLNDSLEIYVLQFAKLYNINYSYIYALYNSNSLYGLNFKQHISEIIIEPDQGNIEDLLYSLMYQIGNIANYLKERQDNIVIDANDKVTKMVSDSIAYLIHIADRLGIKEKIVLNDNIKTLIVDYINYVNYEHNEKLRKLK